MNNQTQVVIGNGNTPNMTGGNSDSRISPLLSLSMSLTPPEIILGTVSKTIENQSSRLMTHLARGFYIGGGI